MRLREFLIDRKYLIIFYSISMLFISTIIFLDETVKVGIENIFYINVVVFVFFCIYLLVEYFFHKRYFTILKDIVDNQQEGIITSLPDANTFEHKIYHGLLRNIYDEQNKKIEKLYEEKKENLEFVTSWVHEIKTPISVSRLVIENSTDKPKEKTLDSLEEELDKIDAYVEQALYFSRIDAFSKDYFINDIELERVVKELVKKHAKTFINKQIKIEIEEVDLTVTSDKKWLIFIIDQILSNSLKYTNKSGKIKIYGLNDEKEKQLIIEDNGVGIRKEDVERIFDQGFTGYSGRENYKSTGMGLYLAKRLARKLGHDITAQSVYGEYTKLTIHFPKLVDYYKLTNL